VTATVSVSDADDGVRMDRSPGSARNSANSTASGVVTVVFGSKYFNRLPVYSGTRSMEWSLTAGTYVSRLPMPNCRPTVKPLSSSAWA
jgi:hypothetical protein